MTSIQVMQYTKNRKQQVIQYIPPQSSGIVHMPLFDFEAFSIFAENYIISSENVAVACDINGEVLYLRILAFVFKLFTLEK